jgi:hypothetical protein
MTTQHLTASDLMIGDWVQVVEEITGTPFVCRVRYMMWTSMENALIGIGGKGISTQSIPAESLCPIPITPEILEKNRFGYVEHDEIVDMRISHYYLGEPNFCENMDLHIGTDNKGHFWINTRSNTIYGLRNVHELQHALKLCGIDKTIEL